MPNRQSRLGRAVCGVCWYGMVEGQRTSPVQVCLVASFLTPSPLAGSCESLDILALSEMAVSFFLKAEGISPRDCNTDEAFAIVITCEGSKPGQGGAGPVRLGARLERRGGVRDVGEYPAEVLLDIVHRVGKGGHKGLICPVERSGRPQTPHSKRSLGKLPPTVRDWVKCRVVDYLAEGMIYAAQWRSEGEFMVFFHGYCPKQVGKAVDC